MQVKTVNPINFLYFQAVTTVNKLVDYLPVGQELIREAVKYGLPVTGPIQWHYFDLVSNDDHSFRLEVALPVGEVAEEYDGSFHFKRTVPFKCVSIEHEGKWADLPLSYARAFQYLNEQQLNPTHVNREVYINVDLKYEEANVTEIQIGIK